MITRDEHHCMAGKIKRDGGIHDMLLRLAGSKVCSQPGVRGNPLATRQTTSPDPHCRIYFRHITVCYVCLSVMQTSLRDTN